MPGQVLARLAEPTSLDAADDARDRSPVAPVPAPATVPLTRLPRNATGTVAGVRVEARGPDGTLDPDVERMALRLIEIGFVRGASLRVIAFGQPGDDPIGVRVGGRGGVSTFALRRAEAACVQVWPDEQS
jgi:ferrous iron transport protein A